MIYPSGLIVRKLDSKFRSKLSGGSSPLGAKVRDETRHQAKLSGTFPREGVQRPPGDGGAGPRTRRGSASALHGSTSERMERKESGGLEQLARHGVRIKPPTTADMCLLDRSFFLFIKIPIHLSIYLSISICMCLSIYQAIYLFYLYLKIYLSI